MASKRNERLGQIGVVEDRDASPDEFVKEPGKQLSQDLGPSPQQGMHMAALRNAPPVDCIVGQYVPLHHGDRLIKVGKHPRGQQPAHARAENHRMLTDLRHEPPPNLDVS